MARTAFSRGWEVLGIEEGYRGLLEGRFSIWTTVRWVPSCTGRLMERVPLNEIVGRTRPLGPNIHKRAEVPAGLPEEISYR